MLSSRRPIPARTLSVVCDGLFVSGYLAAADPDLLQSHRITHVLKLFADNTNYPGGAVRVDGVEYLVLPALDRPDFNIGLLCPRALEFIASAIAEGGRVLVHCHAGVSRAPTVVLMYLMVHKRMSLRRAWLLLRYRRPFILPNPGFWAELQAADWQLQIARSASSGGSITEPRGSSRRPPSRLA